MDHSLQENKDKQQHQLYMQLLNTPVELQAGLLTRMMEDPGNHEHDSAMFLLGQVMELLQMKKHMQRFIIQGSDKHIGQAAKIASTIATLIKQVNLLLAKDAEKGGSSQEPTFDQDSPEFARAGDYIDMSVETGVYRDDAEQESTDERIEAIDALTRVPLDQISRLDEIERAASIVHDMTAKNDDDFS